MQEQQHRPASGRSRSPGHVHLVAVIDRPDSHLAVEETGVAGVRHRRGEQRDWQQRGQPALHGYFAAISAAVMSSMRLLKPHSLSYQASTFASVPPVTLVSVAS